jgi:two-component system CheB/CheR fusion protein
VTQRKLFPVVGIGASAGGLAAFEAFFSGMPPDVDTGMAYVLVQHLAPDHKSILSDLVRRFTRMQVFDALDGMVVEPNCAYVIPPNRDMAFLKGRLQLSESTSRGKRRSVDFFFASLARDQREHAIGVVLSGTGSDGTAGVRAIKAEGGMVMVQSPETTDNGAMPRSAIATGLVDFTLPPDQMPRSIMGYVADAFGSEVRAPATELSLPEEGLNQVLLLLCAETGKDFSQYKRSAVSRRVARRMAQRKVEHVDDYLRYARQAPDEMQGLLADLLVGVTSFFRDPAAFAALETDVIPRLFAAKAPGSAIRVWVPACSTGEEAYSVAMLMQEQAARSNRGHTVQLFATDIDSHAIGVARSGVYAATLTRDVPADRLARHFLPEPDASSYRIRKNIRESLVFSEQNVLTDPPFSRLDLISCRNLLIYMSPPLQKRLIASFHFALNPGGTLLLGTSESVGEAADLFAIENRRASLFLRKDGALAARRAATLRLPRKVPDAEEDKTCPSSSDVDDPDPRIAALQHDLRARQEDLLSTNEELETANEELNNVNEEMQSVNEELQSTNEELETSREELQSLNEELSNVNEQLQSRVTELSRSNEDMNSLLAGIGVGTVFLNSQLIIQRFTPAVTKIIHLIPSDLGRPIGHIALNLLGYDQLVEDVLAVLASSTPKDVEVMSRDGVWFLLRIRPYATLEDTNDGAVITFFEITAMKKAQQSARDAEEIRGLASVLRDSHDAVTVFDLEGRTLGWNAGAQRMYGWTESDVLTMNLSDRLPASSSQDELAVMRRLSLEADLKLHRTERIARDGTVVPICLTASPLLDADGQIYAIATTERARALPTTGESQKGLCDG